MKANKSGLLVVMTPICIVQRPINLDFVDFHHFFKLSRQIGLAKKGSAKSKAIRPWTPLAIAAVHADMTEEGRPIDAEGG